LFKKRRILPIKFPSLGPAASREGTGVSPNSSSRETPANAIPRSTPHPNGREAHDPSEARRRLRTDFFAAFFLGIAILLSVSSRFRAPPDELSASASRPARVIRALV